MLIEWGVNGTCDKVDYRGLSDPAGLMKYKSPWITHHGATSRSWYTLIDPNDLLTYPGLNTLLPPSWSGTYPLFTWLHLYTVCPFSFQSFLNLSDQSRSRCKHSHWQHSVHSFHSPTYVTLMAFPRLTAFGTLPWIYVSRRKASNKSMNVSEKM